MPASMYLDEIINHIQEKYKQAKIFIGKTENQSSLNPYLKRAIIQELADIGESLTYFRPPIWDADDKLFNEIVIEDYPFQIDGFNKLAFISAKELLSNYKDLNSHEQTINDLDIEMQTQDNWLFYYARKSLPQQIKYAEENDQMSSEEVKKIYTQSLFDVLYSVEIENKIEVGIDNKEIELYKKDKEEQIKNRLEDIDEQKTFEKYYIDYRILHLQDKYGDSLGLEHFLLENLQNREDTNGDSLLQKFTAMRNKLKHKYPFEHRAGNESIYETSIEYFKKNIDSLDSEINTIIINSKDYENIEIIQKQYTKNNDTPENKSESLLLEEIKNTIEISLYEIDDLIKGMGFSESIKKEDYYMSGLRNNLETIYKCGEQLESLSKVLYNNYSNVFSKEDFFEEKKQLFNKLNDDTKLLYQNFGSKRRELAHSLEEIDISNINLGNFELLKKNFLEPLMKIITELKEKKNIEVGEQENNGQNYRKRKENPTQNEEQSQEDNNIIDDSNLTHNIVSPPMNKMLKISAIYKNINTSNTESVQNTNDNENLDPNSEKLSF